MAGTQLYYVYDFTRIKNRVSFTQPVSLVFKGTRKTSPVTDTIQYYMLIEREAATDFNISNSQVQIMKVL